MEGYKGINCEGKLFTCLVYKPVCLQNNFHGRVLSIRGFYGDGHYGLSVSPLVNTKNRITFIGEHLMADSVLWLSQSDYSICIGILVEFY